MGPLRFPTCRSRNLVFDCLQKLVPAHARRNRARKKSTRLRKGAPPSVFQIEIRLKKVHTPKMRNQRGAVPAATACPRPAAEVDTSQLRTRQLFGGPGLVLRQIGQTLAIRGVGAAIGRPEIKQMVGDTGALHAPMLTGQNQIGATPDHYRVEQCQAVHHRAPKASRRGACPQHDEHQPVGGMQRPLRMAAHRPGQAGKRA